MATSLRNPFQLSPFQICVTTLPFPLISTILLVPWPPFPFWDNSVAVQVPFPLPPIPCASFLNLPPFPPLPTIPNQLPQMCAPNASFASACFCFARLSSQCNVPLPQHLSFILNGGWPVVFHPLPPLFLPFLHFPQFFANSMLWTSAPNSPLHSSSSSLSHSKKPIPPSSFFPFCPSSNFDSFFFMLHLTYFAHSQTENLPALRKLSRKSIWY